MRRSMNALAATTTATILAAGTLTGCGEARNVSPDCDLKGADAATVQAETTAMKGVAKVIYQRHGQLPAQFRNDDPKSTSIGIQFPLEGGGQLKLTYTATGKLKNGVADPNHVKAIEGYEFRDSQMEKADFGIHVLAIGCNRGWLFNWQANDGAQIFSSDSDYNTSVQTSPNASPSIAAEGVKDTDKAMKQVISDLYTLAAREPHHPGIDLAPPVTPYNR